MSNTEEIKKWVLPVFRKISGIIRTYYPLARDLIHRMFQHCRKWITWFFHVPREWPFYQKAGWRLMNLFVIFILYLLVVDINLFWLFGRSPKIRHIFNPEIKITSELYSSDGKLLGRYFDENRQPMKFEEIPEDFIKALIATEDSRFYHHIGIDPGAALSVFWYYLKGERRGGSTITQQLVKNLLKTRSHYSTGLLGRIPGLRLLIYKTKEWTASLKIEALFTKKEILTSYINTIDFGNNSFGLKTAASTYFSTTPDKLAPEQSALLIGMLKAPTYYSPVNKPERATERRNVVFSRMLDEKLLTRASCDSLCSLPLRLRMNITGHGGDESSYIRDAVSYQLKSWLKDKGIDLYTDGLKIFCTIDSKMQDYAEKAVATHMKRLQKRFNQHWEGQQPWSDKEGNEIPGFIDNIAKGTSTYRRLASEYAATPDSIDFFLNLPYKMKVFTWEGDKDTALSVLDSIRYYQHFLHAGFVAMDPQNAYVKAWVGGINHQHFKFDHVSRSRRQPGSTFKAFVYSAAMAGGYGPCDTRIDQPVIFHYVENGKQKTWAPKNADWSFSGREMTLKHAFARSVNSIAVQITKEIGWKKVIEFAYKMGIKTELKDVPSVCLGSSDVSLYELVNAYCTMVNGGYRVEPVLIERIEDRQGKVLYKAAGNRISVLDKETAFYMQQLLLAGLTEPGGTTQALWEYPIFNYGTEFGGKTGTSSNHSDGWFIGITPKLVAGSWVGGENRSIHFKTSELGEGCKTALPIYGLFMESVLPDQHFREIRARFPKPGFKLSKYYTCHTVLPEADSLAGDSLGTEESLPEDLPETP